MQCLVSLSTLLKLANERTSPAGNQMVYQHEFDVNIAHHEMIRLLSGEMGGCLGLLGVAPLVTRPGLVSESGCGLRREHP